MMDIYVIKIGGNVIDNEPKLGSFLREFSEIKGKKILIHGGGKVASSIGEKLGISPNYIDGRRITDDQTIDLVTMVYGGLINKKLVSRLQSLNVNAIGITGADGNLIPAHKREVKQVDYGWVGDIDEKEMDVAKWKALLDDGFIPVVAPLTHDGQGNILNTNADTIASVLAVCLSKEHRVKLIYCFEKNGVLLSMKDENSVIEQLKHKEYQILKEEDRLFAGILPKIDNAFRALQKGVDEVVIGNANQLQALIHGAGGTKISK